MRLDAIVENGTFQNMKKRGSNFPLVAFQAVKDQTDETKNAYRTAVTNAGLGARAANSIRSGIRKEPNNYAGFIYSKWKKRSAALGGTTVDIITTFEQGTVIRPFRGQWLAYPTPEAGIRRPIRDVREWARGKGLILDFIPPRNGRSEALLVERAKRVRRSQRGVRRLAVRTIQRDRARVLFILIRLHRVPKSLDLKTVQAAARRRFPQKLLAAGRGP